MEIPKNINTSLPLKCPLSGIKEDFHSCSPLKAPDLDLVCGAWDLDRFHIVMLMLISLFL